MDIYARIQIELDRAHAAQEAGKQGMARVCARRSAGMAVKEYLHHKGIETGEFNNFELMASPEFRRLLPESVQTSLERLTMTVDMDYNLPVEIDLIEDARQVIKIIITGEKLDGD